MSSQEEVSSLYAVVDRHKKRRSHDCTMTPDVQETNFINDEPELPARKLENSPERNEEDQEVEFAPTRTNDNENTVDLTKSLSAVKLNKDSRCWIGLAVTISIIALLLITIIAGVVSFLFTEILVLKSGLNNHGNHSSGTNSNYPDIRQQISSASNTSHFSVYKELQEELTNITNSIEEVALELESNLYLLSEQTAENISESIATLYEILENKTQMLNQSLQTLDHALMEIKENTSFQFIQQANESSRMLTATLQSSSSCAEILHKFPSSPSGHYAVQSASGLMIAVYCDMTRSCGNITGGWMRVAQLDPSQCPPGFSTQYFNASTVQTCVAISRGCTTITYSSNNINFSKVCGQIRGYQLGTPDGFHSSFFVHEPTVSDNYLDGVSITSNGIHIWSLGAGCSCDSIIFKPSFVGNDWTCDSNISPRARDTLCHLPLWSSQRCGNDTPWIFKTLSSSHTADIQVRVCRDEDMHNENIAMAAIDLYLQ